MEIEVSTDCRIEVDGDSRTEVDGDSRTEVDTNSIIEVDTNPRSEFDTNSEMEVDTDSGTFSTSSYSFLDSTTINDFFTEEFTEVDDLIVAFRKEYEVMSNIMLKLRHREVHGSHIVTSCKQRSNLQFYADTICAYWNAKDIEARRIFLELGNVTWDLNICLPLSCVYDLLNHKFASLNILEEKCKFEKKLNLFWKLPRLAKSTLKPCEFHCLQFYGGRHPLCGVAVTSLIWVIIRPPSCKPRSDDFFP